MICFSLDQLDFGLVNFISRWVVNVANEALVHDEFKLAPNGKIYRFYLGAKGTAISLVSYYVDRVCAGPKSDESYTQSPDSCIDIFFTFVPPTDGPIIISEPSNSLFCAGGRGVRGRTPPGLDATHFVCRLRPLTIAQTDSALRSAARLWRRRCRRAASM